MLFGLGVVASLSVLTSCKKDEVVPEGPKITFANGADIQVDDTTSSYTFVANIEAAGELKEIKLFKVTEKGEEQLGTAITSFNTKTSYVLNHKIDLVNFKGEIKIKVSVTDSKNQTNSSNFTVKKPGSISSYSAVIMAAQFNEGGSFLSTSNGTVYKKTDVKTNASLIDLVYSYRGADMLAFIAAPSDTILDKTLNIKADAWSVYNSTKFKLSSISSQDFDLIKNDSKYSEITNLVNTKVLNLKVGNVVAFETAAGKLGYFKVKAINQGTTGANDIQKFQYGNIEIDVKVQK